VSNIFARKSMAVLKAEAEETEAQALVTHGGVPLKRTLSAWSLISLGIGCIIGAGIFVLTGHAAATNAGPAIALSFVLGGIACAFAALGYYRRRELASACMDRALRLFVRASEVNAVGKISQRLVAHPARRPCGCDLHWLRTTATNPHRHTRRPQFACGGLVIVGQQPTYAYSCSPDGSLPRTYDA